LLKIKNIVGYYIINIMNLMKGFFIIALIIGIVLLIMYYILNQEEGYRQNIVYKYIPRTLEEDEMSPIYVSEIFKTMFTQPSIWIDSINKDQNRMKEKIDKFYISQM
jgi:hypothetical protein